MSCPYCGGPTVNDDGTYCDDPNCPGYDEDFSDD